MLYGWKGNEPPTVIVETVKPKWRKGEQYTTRAIRIRTPKRFHALVRRMLVHKLDLTLNDSTATFVDAVQLTHIVFRIRKIALVTTSLFEES